MKNLLPTKILLLSIIINYGCMQIQTIEISNDVSTDNQNDAIAAPTTYPVCPLGWKCDSFRYPIVDTSPPIDILVVIDNSASMAAEQEILIRTFPSMIRNLLDPPLDPLTGRRIHTPISDLHIGVISTDMGVAGYPGISTCDDNPVTGDDGKLLNQPHGNECPSFFPAKYLDYYTEGGQEPDIEEINKLISDFGCIALLGIDGCGFEQPMEATYKALLVHTLPGGVNYGFIRENSIMEVIFVTDEDDCSAADFTLFDISNISWDINLQCYYNQSKLHPVTRYSDMFRIIKPEPGRLFVGMIVGVPADLPECNGKGNNISDCLTLPQMQQRLNRTQTGLEYVCTYPVGCTPEVNCITEPVPARRFVELARNIGENATICSICTEDFSPIFEDMRKEIIGSIRSNCQISINVTVSKTDQCHCRANCKLIEMLSDNRSCPPEKPPYFYQPNTGDITNKWKNPDTGKVHSLCEIPASLTSISDCLLSCVDPSQRHNQVTEGWHYVPVTTENPCSEVKIAESLAPANDSILILMCP